MAYWGIRDPCQRLKLACRPVPRRCPQAWLGGQSRRPERHRRKQSARSPGSRRLLPTTGDHVRSSRNKAARGATKRRWPACRRAIPRTPKRRFFYALALNEAADPADKTYVKQLKAADILEKLEVKYPNHPGIPHYIIHSYDYPELAMRGVFKLLPGAQSFSRFRRHTSCTCPRTSTPTLGMWQEVIGSDRAADDEALAYAVRVLPQAAAEPAKNPARYHSLDFLTNAYLQLGQDQQAKRIVEARNSVTEFSGRIPLQRAHRLCGHTGPLQARARGLDRGSDACSSENTISPASRSDHVVRPRDRCCTERRSDDSPGRPSISSTCSGERLAQAEYDAYWTEQVLIQEYAAAGWPLRSLKDAKGMPFRPCVTPPTWKIEAANMSRWKTVSHRSGNCSASCCSKPMNPRRRCRNSRRRCVIILTAIAPLRVPQRPPNGPAIVARPNATTTRSS